MAMQAAAEKRQNKPRLRTSRGFWLWMLPVIIAYGLFKYWPMVYSFILSFADWNFVGEFSWVGLSNYANMFTKTMFSKGIVNTLKYIAWLFPFFVVLPLIFSVMLMNVRSKRAQELYKGLFFVPNILALSIVCMVWLWIFSTSYGLLNNILALLGKEPVKWLTDRNTAFTPWWRCAAGNIWA